ncbi:hypothetical protein Hanom_Chr13g01186081 [Helianthus anomalus]
MLRILQIWNEFWSFRHGCRQWQWNCNSNKVKKGMWAFISLPAAVLW